MRLSLSLLTILWSCGTPELVAEPNGNEGSGTAGLTDSGSAGSGGMADTSNSDSGGGEDDSTVADSGNATGEEGAGDDGGSASRVTGGGGSTSCHDGQSQLQDLNPESPRFGDTISPRDYMAEVSGWYFIKGSRHLPDPVWVPLTNP